MKHAVKTRKIIVVIEKIIFLNILCMFFKDLKPNVLINMVLTRRPDIRQYSRGRLGRSSIAKTAVYMVSWLRRSDI